MWLMDMIIAGGAIYVKLNLTLQDIIEINVIGRLFGD
jgi:hypothetical protein